MGYKQILPVVYIIYITVAWHHLSKSEGAIQKLFHSPGMSGVDQIQKVWRRGGETTSQRVTSLL